MRGAASPFPCARRRPCCSTWRSKEACIRSKLAAFLWPDSEPHAARTGLRTALTLLRSLLADSDASLSPHSHLLNEHELLGLNPHAPLELDLDVVQQAYQALRLPAVQTEHQRA